MYQTFHGQFRKQHLVQPRSVMDKSPSLTGASPIYITLFTFASPAGRALCVGSNVVSKSAKTAILRFDRDGLIDFAIRASKLIIAPGLLMDTVLRAVPVDGVARSSLPA